LPETASSLADLKRATDAHFPIVSDIDSAYALSVGVVMPVDGVLQQMLLADGIDLMHLHAGSGALMPLPATFVVAMDGRISARFVSPDFRTRMETTDLLAALDHSANGARPEPRRRGHRSSTEPQ
jgi:peroxiredoxin